MSPEEVARLIDSSQTRFHRIVLMTLYGTGARRAELARLQIPDIDSGRMVSRVFRGKFIAGLRSPQSLLRLVANPKRTLMVDGARFFCSRKNR